MSASVRIIVGCTVSGMQYVKGKTYEVADDVANDLLMLGTAVAGDEATAARVRSVVEWTEAPAAAAQHERAPNWIRRKYG